jgi:signal transduction histidine kinase
MKLQFDQEVGQRKILEADTSDLKLQIEHSQAIIQQSDKERKQLVARIQEVPSEHSSLSSNIDSLFDEKKELKLLNDSLSKQLQQV